MPEELLQRMRDIHYPDAPGWFPPAPGWWILLALVIAGLCFLALWLRSRRRARAPYAHALQLLSEATDQHARGELASRAYIDTCNQLLKRLLVHVRHSKAAVSASGTRWLTELDRLHGGNQFTRGAGKALGDSRFAPTPPPPEPELDSLIRSFIKRLQTSEEVGEKVMTSGSHQERSA